MRLRVLSWSHGVTLRGPAGGGGEVAVVRPAEEDMVSRQLGLEACMPAIG